MLTLHASPLHATVPARQLYSTFFVVLFASAFVQCLLLFKVFLGRSFSGTCCKKKSFNQNYFKLLGRFLYEFNVAQSELRQVLTGYNKIFMHLFCTFKIDYPLLFIFMKRRDSRSKLERCNLSEPQKKPEMIVESSTEVV